MLFELEDVSYSRSGTPVLRALFYHFSDDPGTYQIHDQVMLGPFLMAAPVYHPGRDYRAVYLPKGGDVTVKLEPGRYRASWFDPLVGDTTPAGDAQGPGWTSPKAPQGAESTGKDWALLLRRAR